MSVALSNHEVAQARHLGTGGLWEKIPRMMPYSDNFTHTFVSSDMYKNIPSCPSRRIRLEGPPPLFLILLYTPTVSPHTLKMRIASLALILASTLTLTVASPVVSVLTNPLLPCLAHAHDFTFFFFDYIGRP